MTMDRKTALVLEDSPAQALALKQVLEQEGLRVLWALDGKVGVAMAREHLPDVILLDVEMPEMNGFEACRVLKENPQTSEIPVIILTVRTEPAAVMQGIDMGAVDFVPKDTFSIAVLLETLRQLHILDRPSVATVSRGDQMGSRQPR